MKQAFSAYKQEVETLAFPAQEHTVDMPDEEWQALLEAIKE
jgi:ketopantoate hydroxymethyltransferase